MVSGQSQPQPLLSVDDALTKLLGRVRVNEAQLVSIDSAEGLVLARPILSPERHPADDMSAMDGYAVQAQDLESATAETPVDLRLLEDIRAGHPPEQAVQTRTTSRISTGALIPVGANAVVMREVCEVLDEQTIRFTGTTYAGSHIRCAGEHLEMNEQVLSSGTILRSAQMGMAAFLGQDRLWCHPRVTVAVLATGSELVAVGSGQKLQRGQIRDSNSVALAAALRSLGCTVTMSRCVADSPEELDRALGEAFSHSQVVLTSGGISAGWHDLVRGRIERMGGEFAFHKLRMRPGKPLAFGQCGNSHFFCLPGNPVSSLVTFEVFVKPALLKVMGRPHRPSTRKARLSHRVEKKLGFSVFLRGILDESESGLPSVRLTGPQGSHVLQSLVQANVLIRTEQDDEVLEEGSVVQVLPYNLT